jgi:hypothetical protein
LQTQDKEKENETAARDFLEALRFQYEKELELRNILDNKTSNIITMSSSIITIAIAVSTFLLSKIEYQPHLIAALCMLAVVLGFATFAIYYLLKAYSLRKYRFAITSESFFDKGAYNKDLAKRFLTTEREKFAERMAEEYLTSINQNKERNGEKARFVKNGQKSLYWSLFILSILVGFAVVIVTLQSAQ